MLVVVHNWNIERLLQALLNVEAFRSLDVLKVDTTECWGNLLYSLTELLRILLVNLDVEYVNTTVDLEEKSLTFHYWLA